MRAKKIWREINPQDHGGRGLRYLLPVLATLYSDLALPPSSHFTGFVLGIIDHFFYHHLSLLLSIVKRLKVIIKVMIEVINDSHF